ncbi:amidohydrolase family protein [Actinomycetospora sp. TBRC 11914]|uniref:amidohydrolase family protein n=1 Tax=Actinomycetospora sp. TBRC 11914 TaxID=2729387 RepID=UPI00145E36E7|nr:amidohydrolase family protein [Actinomycetospora sp. TBRC 11914]NMO91716.1 amidohydrolase family protein [Actinomycetospora sp. TBRC 11914]
MGPIRRLCDAHLHVVRGRPGPDAAVDDARRHLGAVGADRAVVVQAAADGADPTVLLRALPRLGVAARGVVSVAAVEPATVPALHEAGVRGVRLSGLGGTPATGARLRDAAALAADAGWHLAYYPMSADEWAELGPELGRLDVPVVVDHMALRAWDAARGPEQAGFRLLLDLVDDGVWVKISGAFRRGWADALPYARLLVQHSPSRAVWGSDWPYLALDGPPPTTEQLLDWLGEALPDEAGRRRVLVGNPEALYEFDDPEEGRPCPT